MGQTVAIIQTRMSSTRLPGKAMKELCGKPVLGHIVERVKQSRELDKVVIATSIGSEDDQIEVFAKEHQYCLYRGSLDNVLERFYFCAKMVEADIVVRLTGDNTLVDPFLIDEAIRYFRNKSTLDYLYYKQGVPLGMAVEVFQFSALESAYREASNKACIEHVTPYLYQNPQRFRIEHYNDGQESLAHYRWTLDTEEDWRLIEALYGYLYKGRHDFYLADILDVMQAHPELYDINKDIEQKKLGTE
jgi:spore coat polysaccharide biosynthesis protein SpsF